MKTEMPFGTLVLPGDWEDQSTYRFMSPESPALAAPLAKGRGSDVRGSRVSVVVGRLELGKARVEDVVTQQEQLFRAQFDSMSKVERAPQKHPSGREIPTLAFTFDVPGAGTLRQIMFFFGRKKKGDVVALSLTCGALDFDKRKAEVEDIFAKFSIKE